MPLIELSRFYPATPDETYKALVQAVQQLARFKSCDDFSRSVSFVTKMTGGPPARMCRRMSFRQTAGATSAWRGKPRCGPNGTRTTPRTSNSTHFLTKPASGSSTCAAHERREAERSTPAVWLGLSAQLE